MKKRPTPLPQSPSWGCCKGGEGRGELKFAAPFIISANRGGLRTHAARGMAMAMNAAALFRLGAVAAIAGGAARILTATPLIADPLTLEWLYTGIDILLVFGLFAIYLDRFERLGFLGLMSFIVGVAALSFIGGPDADPFGFSTYEQGATTLAIAMIGLSLAWLRAGERPWGPPLCWFGSAIAIGVLGTLPAPMPSYGFPVAGALFGAGFVWAGVALLTRRA